MLVDKAAGMSSHDVVDRIRRVLGTRTAGHTGTLDPFATGLLVVLLGRATRLARFVERQSKTYLATARLGTRTDTDDLSGQIIGSPVSVDTLQRSAVEEALKGFLGRQLQQPPQYSAKHVAGERSYRKARRGEPVELAPVTITVERIKLLDYRPPVVSFRTMVSAGTYVRALARDLGERLGVGGHLIQLRREAIGALRVDDAVPLERLNADSVLPPQVVLTDLPTLELDEVARKAITHGRPVVDSGEAGRRGSGEVVALVSGGELVGVAEADEGWLRPTVVLQAP